MKNKLLLLAGLLVSAHAYALTTSEEQILTFINAHKKQNIKFLEKIVNINSGTLNTEGVYNTGKIVAQELRKLGFKISWKEMPKNMRRAPTLIATINHPEAEKIVLIGHLDTVFPKQAKFKKFSVEGNYGRGQGTMDDKGGIAVLLLALQALKFDGVLDKSSITVILTGDEESSGKPNEISRKPLIDAAQGAKIAIDFEPTVSLDSATVARRGYTSWKLTSTGEASHSALIFQKDVGDGAIFNIAYQLNLLREALKGVKLLTFNPGLIAGGGSVTYSSRKSTLYAVGKTNVVAKEAIIRGDFRSISLEQRKMVKDKMHAIIQKHLPKTSSTITFVDGKPPMSPKKENDALLKQFSDISEELGYGKVRAINPLFKGAADISYVASFVPANLSGLGPYGFGEHTKEESVELSTIPIQAKRTAILLYRLINRNLKNHVH